MQKHDWATDIANALSYSIIAHPMWAKSIPPDLRGKIPLARLVQILKEPDKCRDHATDEEAMTSDIRSAQILSWQVQVSKRPGT